MVQERKKQSEDGVEKGVRRHSSKTEPSEDVGNADSCGKFNSLYDRDVRLHDGELQVLASLLIRRDRIINRMTRQTQTHAYNMHICTHIHVHMHNKKT